MSKAGKQIIKTLEQVKDFIVHPGKQPIRIAGESVIISVEYYERLKRSEFLVMVAALSDEQLKELAGKKLKVACDEIKAKLPRYIETQSAASIKFRDGFEDVISSALSKAERVWIDA